MIEKRYGAYVLVCDDCGLEFDEYDTFQDAVDAKDRFGWKSERQGGEWVNVCPERQGG